MDAKEVIDKIGIGVLKALDTCERFLGVEEFSTRNADIYPEYVTTVMVGRALTGVDRWVSLEARMKDLGQDAARIGHSRTYRTSAISWPAIKLALSHPDFLFGKKRLDVLVRKASSTRAPLLIAEAKLGVRNVSGVIKDINRIVNLFDLYEAAGAIGTDTMYGAVVFHVMEERGTEANLPDQAAALLEKIKSHLATLGPGRPKLSFNAGLLTRTLKTTEASGYDELHDDGTIERVFEKHGYAFQAGLALIGTAADVTTATF